MDYVNRNFYNIRRKCANILQPQKAVQVFQLGPENKIIFNPEILEIFDNNYLEDKKVCIISVAGAFRLGKSFLLSFFLHYFNKRLKHQNRWLDRSKHLIKQCFKWTQSSERCTEGILMWSEIFLLETPSGEEVAVILLDTQGSFDHATNMTQCASIFALSTLISSVQIYNVRNNLNLDHLQHLQLFSGYGSTLCDNESDEKPFEKLLILIRDWECEYDYEYGFGGGKQLLDGIFKKHQNSKSEKLINIQETMQENYEKIECFLLPHPGTDIITKDFVGDFSHIGEDFLDHVENLISDVLSPENLVPKKFYGKFITLKNLLQIITTYSKLFQEGKQPTVPNLCQATAECNLENLVIMFSKKYEKEIKKRKSQNAEELKIKIVEEFRSWKKMGDTNMIKKYEEKLLQVLDEIKHKRYNKSGSSFFSNPVADGIVMAVSSLAGAAGGVSLTVSEIITVSVGTGVVGAAGIVGAAGLAAGVVLGLTIVGIKKLVSNIFTKPKIEEGRRSIGGTGNEEEAIQETGNIFPRPKIEEGRSTAGTGNEEEVQVVEEIQETGNSQENLSFGGHEAAEPVEN